MDYLFTPLRHLMAEKFGFTYQSAPFSGRYPSFKQAKRAATKHSRQLGISKDELQRLRTDRGVESQDPVAEAIVATLSRPGSRVVDIGGRFSHLSKTHESIDQDSTHLDWISINWQTGAALGEKGKAASRINGLSLKPELGSIACADVLISWGVLPYMENDLATLLLDYDALPGEIVLSDLALTERPTFTTLHRVGREVAPYRVENRQNLIDQMAGFGYRLLKEWQTGDSEFSLPGYQNCDFTCFQGLHFRHQNTG